MVQRQGKLRSCLGGVQGSWWTREKVTLLITVCSACETLELNLALEVVGYQCEWVTDVKILKLRRRSTWGLLSCRHLPRTWECGLLGQLRLPCQCSPAGSMLA